MACLCDALGWFRPACRVRKECQAGHMLTLDVNVPGGPNVSAGPPSAVKALNS